MWSTQAITFLPLPFTTPHVVETMHYLNDVYAHYGYVPPWEAGGEIA